MNDGPTDDPLSALAAAEPITRLRELGWLFTPAHDDAGEPIQLNGLRTWPGGQADAIRIRSTTDVAAIRFGWDASVMWTYDGTLPEVVDHLLALPAP